MSTPDDGVSDTTNGEAPADGIVRLVTAPEREAEAEREFEDAIYEEAMGILDDAAEIFEEKGVAGLAIAFVFKDGSYGQAFSSMSSNMSGLIGAIATMQQDLILRTLRAEEE